MQFNAKINTDGEYRQFHGWTVICDIKNDMKFIENYIKHHNTLSKYFSALPQSSYHITLYNIWSNGRPLLNHQKKYIEHNLPFQKNKLEDISKQQDFFNPGECINNLLYKLAYECNQDTWEEIRLKIKNVVFNGNTIRISVKKWHVLDKMNNIRKRLTDICENDDGMGSYHVTLAYKYKDINEEEKKKIDHEVGILNLLLKDQSFILKRPSVCYFSNMKEFKPFTESFKHPDCLSKIE
jgi:hypothetical protein